MDFLEPGDGSEVDKRRHRIFFQQDQEEPVEYTDLYTRTYLRLKKNNDWTYRYFKGHNEQLQLLYRSLDAVEFDLILPPEDLESNEQSFLTTPQSEDTRTVDPDNFSERTENRVPSKAVRDNGSAVATAAPSDKSKATSTFLNQSNRGKEPSTVWKHFEKVDNSSAKCKYCGNNFKHGGNTTNLMQHLRRKHQLYVINANPNKKRKNDSCSDDNLDAPAATKSASSVKSVSTGKNPPLITEAFNRIHSFKDKGETHELITLAILHLLCGAKLPLSLVEHPAFRTLMEVVAPLYSVPSRKTITTKMKSRYEVLKDAFKKNLVQAQSYTLTCDNWTDVTNDSYLGVTIHYLAPNLEMKTAYLGVIPLHDRHTTLYLDEKLEEVIEDFDLDKRKITAGVSDSAASIKAAVKKLLGEERQLACYAHKLSHLVPDVLKYVVEAAEIIKKVKRIVSLTKRSNVASDELKRLQERDGKKPLKFVMDIEIRWVYTLTMIERFLELEEYVYAVTMKCVDPPEMLTREEIDILKELAIIMKPIQVVITEISGSTYPTASLMIPIIHGMNNAVSKVFPQTEVGKKFQNLLLQRIDESFKHHEFHTLLARAALLDPRFKKIDFQNKVAVVNSMRGIDRLLRKSSIEAVHERKENVQLSNNQKNTTSIWDLHDNLVERIHDEKEENDNSYHPELDHFLKQPVITRNSDPFKHWESIKSAYPTLYPIAMKYLSLIASSVPSERLFSLAGNIKDIERACLTGENLNKLLFLSCLSREEWGL